MTAAGGNGGGGTAAGVGAGATTAGMTVPEACGGGTIAGAISAAGSELGGSAFDQADGARVGSSCARVAGTKLARHNPASSIFFARPTTVHVGRTIAKTPTYRSLRSEPNSANDHCVHIHCNRYGCYRLHTERGDRYPRGGRGRSGILGCYIPQFLRPRKVTLLNLEGMAHAAEPWSHNSKAVPRRLTNGLLLSPFRREGTSFFGGIRPALLSAHRAGRTPPGKPAGD